MPFYIEAQRGRLTIFSFSSPSSPGEAKAVREVLISKLSSRARDAILVGDCTRLALLPTEIADSIVDVMRSGNPFVDRTAILLAPHSPAMQMYRIIKEAEHPRRQMFRSARRLDAWLRPSLNLPEHAVLSAYLTRHGLLEPDGEATEAER